MRTIWAEIGVYEEQTLASQEQNGCDDMGTLEFFDQEFGWLSGSGFFTRMTYLADSDDPSTRARYINYLMDWAMEFAEDLDRTDSPLPYEDWLKTNQ